MNYQEFDFQFEEAAGTRGIESANSDVSLFDVRLRLGNTPIVKNLFKLFNLKKEEMPPDMQVLYEQKDIYSVVHAISTISKSSYVAELVYDAEMLDLPGAQTIDLMPHTRFSEWFKADLNLEVALSASGNISAELPKELLTASSWNNVDLGAGIKLKTATTGGLAGKFSFSISWPVVQSMGVASNRCSWLLRPETSKALNGDQLLVQVIAVPKGTEKLKYRISGEVTADRGMFWKEQTQQTKPIEVEVVL